jgi:hypothetical protein
MATNLNVRGDRGDDLVGARTRVRQTGMGVRTLGSPVPAVDFALAAIMLALGIGAVVLSGGKAVGWVVFAVCGAFTAYLAVIGEWSRRHHDRIAAYWHARRDLARASMRRHPVRWLVGMPIAAGVDAALRWDRYDHRSVASTVIAAAIGVLIGLVIVVFAVAHARRSQAR